MTACVPLGTVLVSAMRALFLAQQYARFARLSLFVSEQDRPHDALCLRNGWSAKTLRRIFASFNLITSQELSCVTNMFGTCFDRKGCKDPSRVNRTLRRHRIAEQKADTGGGGAHKSAMSWPRRHTGSKLIVRHSLTSICKLKGIPWRASARRISNATRLRNCASQRPVCRSPLRHSLSLRWRATVGRSNCVWSASRICPCAGGCISTTNG